MKEFERMSENIKECGMWKNVKDRGGLWRTVEVCGGLWENVDEGRRR